MYKRQVKEQAYQQQIIEQQLIHDQQAVKSDLDLTITKLGQVLTTSVFENTLIDEGVFTEQLAVLTTQVDASVLNEKEKVNYRSLIKQHALRLTQLPDIARSVSEATSLISKISQLPIPSSLIEYKERQPIFNEWLEHWQVIEKTTNGILPQSIKSAYQQIRSTWQKGLAPFSQQQKRLFSQTQKKINDLKRLLATGKYNASFGLFKAIERSYSNLSSSQQHQLERDFDSLSEKISELSDWEHYIATPRKQQMLDEINAIVACPLDNPNEQASKVKAFRKAWNLLGHADDELDKPLNDAFNLACEQAFSPCRLFFGEQEKIREQNLAIRIALINQVKEFAESASNTAIEELDFKIIDAQLNKLNEAWLEAGEVDRTKSKSLQLEFVDNLEPINAMIKNFHDQNTSLKNALIEKVKAELETEDIYTAIENTKKHQNRWRDIGYAGPRQENKLWQNFRAANDLLFNKRDQLKEEEKNQQLQQKLTFEQKFADIKIDFSTELDSSQLRSVQEQAHALHQEVINLKPLIKSVALTIERFLNQIEDRLKLAETAQEKQIWFNIFSVIESVANNDLNINSINDSADYLALPHAWRKKLVEAMFSNDRGVSDKLHRSSKTLELEVLAGIESPKEFAQQRLDIQIKLMQDKMTSGENVNVELSFNEWLKQGELSTDDLPLISRVKPIFCRP